MMEKNNDINTPNSKLQMKKMLRDAICVFCQSMLSYDLQLTVEALVGVTVDGSDVLLVSINEHFEKTPVSSDCEIIKIESTNGTNTKTSNWSYSGDDCITAVDHFDEHIILQSELNIAPDASKVVLQNDRSANHVKVEAVDFIDHVHSYDILPSYTGLNNIPNDLLACHNNSMECSIASGDGFPVANSKSGEKSMKRQSLKSSLQTGVSTINDIAELNDDCSSVFEDQLVLRHSEADSAYRNSHQSYDAGVKSYRYCFGNNPLRPSSSHSSSTTARRAIVRRAQRQRFESANVSYPANVDTFRGDIDVRRQKSNTAMKLHTCKLCNTQLSRRSSYNRHMRTHQGIAFQCLCGRYFTREDNMKAHSRKCQAVWQNETQNNNNS